MKGAWTIAMLSSRGWPVAAPSCEQLALVHPLSQDISPLWCTFWMRGEQTSSYSIRRTGSPMIWAVHVVESFTVPEPKLTWARNQHPPWLVPVQV